MNFFQAFSDELAKLGAESRASNGEAFAKYRKAVQAGKDPRKEALLRTLKASVSKPKSSIAWFTGVK